LIRDNKPKLLNRLSRIEGQVRGVARMVEEDRYCIDIMTQLQAARAALARVESELLQGHLEHCIEDAIVAGDAAEQRRKASELVALLQRAAR
jgi:DNA-binding FrmR family transcriptional regulator